MREELLKILSYPYVFVLRSPGAAVQFWFGESAPCKITSDLNYQLYVPGFEKDGVSPLGAGNFLSLPSRASFESLLGPEKRIVKKLSRRESPDLAGWKSYCKKIEDGLRPLGAQKIVPVRSVFYSRESGDIDSLELLLRIFEEQSHDLYPFFLKWPGGIFLGKTPELLFSKSADTIRIPVIAGTRVHKGADKDAQAEQLLSDPKERLEHQIVVDGIQASLREMGLEGRLSFGPKPLFLKTLVHLQSEILVKAEGVDSLTLIDHLHPTPAIGGIPRRLAWDFIREHEGQRRGLFSGPILLKDGEEELCLVAIRSALVTKDSVQFFAGAGYVKGSHPEKEWQETAAKMKVMEDLIYGA